MQSADRRAPTVNLATTRLATGGPSSESCGGGLSSQLAFPGLYPPLDPSEARPTATSRLDFPDFPRKPR